MKLTWIRGGYRSEPSSKLLAKIEGMSEEVGGVHRSAQAAHRWYFWAGSERLGIPFVNSFGHPGFASEDEARAHVRGHVEAAIKVCETP